MRLSKNEVKGPLGKCERNSISLIFFFLTKKHSLHTQPPNLILALIFMVNSCRHMEASGLQGPMEMAAWSPESGYMSICIIRAVILSQISNGWMWIYKNKQNLIFKVFTLSSRVHTSHWQAFFSILASGQVTLLCLLSTTISSGLNTLQAFTLLALFIYSTSWS